MGKMVENVTAHEELEAMILGHRTSAGPSGLETLMRTAAASVENCPWSSSRPIRSRTTQSSLGEFVAAEKAAVEG